MLKILVWYQIKAKLKKWQHIFHAIVNANSIVQHVIQMKTRIIKQINVNVKIILLGKKVIVGVLAYKLVIITSI